MSIEAKELEKLGAGQLQELARALLERLEAASGERDEGPNEVCGARAAAKGALDAREELYERRERESFFPQETRESAGQDGEWSPRLTRRQFLDSRLQRRADRQSSDENPAAQAGERADFGSSAPATVRLRAAAERISEAVCRDARRYDGAFEKF